MAHLSARTPLHPGSPASSEGGHAMSSAPVAPAAAARRPADGAASSTPLSWRLLWTLGLSPGGNRGGMPQSHRSSGMLDPFGGRLEKGGGVPALRPSAPSWVGPPPSPPCACVCACAPTRPCVRGCGLHQRLLCGSCVRACVCRSHLAAPSPHPPATTTTQTTPPPLLRGGSCRSSRVFWARAGQWVAQGAARLAGRGVVWGAMRASESRSARVPAWAQLTRAPGFSKQCQLL